MTIIIHCPLSSKVRQWATNYLCINTKTIESPLLKAQDIRELISGTGFIGRSLTTTRVTKVRFNNLL